MRMHFGIDEEQRSMVEIITVISIDRLVVNVQTITPSNSASLQIIVSPI
jgi:hypothetical protein